MTIWFSKNLGDALLADEPLDRIRKRFLKHFAKDGGPEDMAIFIRHESEGRLHCEVNLYFSPAAAAVAKEVDAEPCVRPSSGDLGLFAGSEGAWLTLFPECQN